MKENNKLECFKAYDVRGQLGRELNEDIAYRVGRAVVQSLEAKTVALGFDARETSPSLAKAVASGVCDSGADVLDIGLAGTEEIYSAVSAFNIDAGIEVTASHNPINYNGMKIVKHQSRPLSDQEFLNIKHLAEENNFLRSKRSGSVINKVSSGSPHIVDILDSKKIALVINTGGGNSEHRLNDAIALRRATLKNKVPYCTNMSTALAFIEGIKSLKTKKLEVTSLQEIS